MVYIFINLALFGVIIAFCTPFSVRKFTMSSKAGLFRGLILGAPASGKGTISSRIVKKYGCAHISSGDKLRSHIQNKTALGLEVKKYINEGVLVPDDVMIKFMSGVLAEADNHWLLDGFPRTASQAEQLWKNQTVDFALDLKVPFEVIIERVKGRWIHLASGRVYNTDFNAPKVSGKDDVTGEDLIQRPDDKPEAVLKRLTIYKEMNEPVAEFYKSKGILHEFPGNTSDEIWPKVIEFLDQRLKNAK